MSLAYVIVDVFTGTPLQGNQLAVFEDGSALSDDQMQRLAREMNLSETVFLLPAEDGGDARMRIFTPAAELPFAGHPVLGTAFVVGEARQLTSVQLESAASAVPLRLTRSRRQGAEVGRPSGLHARVNGSPAGIESVEVGGAAVIVARGEFCRW